MERGYAAIRRPWKMGDIVTLDFPMPVERIYAPPACGRMWGALH